MDTNRLVAVTTIPYGGYRYYQPALYEPVARLDGTRTWRRVRLLGSRTRSEIAALDSAYDFAADMAVLYNPEVRHGTAVSDTPTCKEY